MSKIKKKLCLFSLLFVLTIIFLFFKMPNHNVYAFYDGSKEDYIGRGVNVLNDNYENLFDIKTSDIFKDNFITSVRKNIFVGSPELTTSFSGETIQEYYNNIKARYNADLDIAVTNGTYYGVHTGAIKSNFVTNSTIDFSKQRHTFFHRYIYEMKLFELYLPSFYLNKTLYVNNLSDSFLTSLEHLSNNKSNEEIKQFFNNYGTHILTHAYYGARLDVYYTAATNYVNLTRDQKNNINFEINSKISSAMSLESSLYQNINFKQYENLKNMSIITSFYTYKNGGGTFGLSNYYELWRNFKNWVLSINENNASYIGVKDGTLVPIWELLPSQYNDLAEKMEEVYIKLAETEGDNIKESLESDLPDSIRVNFTVRSESIKVTDDGREKNPIDEVDLVTNINSAIKHGDFGISKDYYVDLLNEGFKTIEIKILFEYKEIHDGYQYIFLYKEKNTKSENLLFQERFNAGKNRQNYWRSVATETYTFSIDDLVTSSDRLKLYIYWGASGNLNDDWYNKNVKMQVYVY